MSDVGDATTWSPEAVDEYIAGARPRWPNDEQAREELTRAMFAAFGYEGRWGQASASVRDYWYKRTDAVLKRLNGGEHE